MLSSLGYEKKNNPAFMQFADYAQLPQPVQMQANPKAFIKEGYRRNDTVHKCVSYIARNAAGVRLALYTDATKKREIESHPLLDLLNTPNKDMSGNDFVESVCAYTLLTGNSYQYALRAFKSGPPDEIWSLSPALVDIVPYPLGILRYDYKITSSPVAFEPELIGHTKFWNPSAGTPSEDLYGLSPIEVIGIMVDINLAYRKWNLALTQNYAQPPGAWTTPALLGKKEREALEHQVNQKYQGFKNAGKAPVLDGGLKFESYAVPPAQMAFLEGQGYNSVGIANIYNLAPQVVGDTSSSTYDNFEQAVYGSYTEAIFPLLDKVTGTWRRWLVPMYPDLKKAYLSYDKTSVETIQKIMQAQESAKAERWTKIWLAGGCTLARYQEETGQEPDAQGNVYRIKDTLVPADKLTEYAEANMTKPTPQPFDNPGGNNLNDGKTQPGKEGQTGKREKQAYEHKAFDLSTTEQKAAYFTQMESIRERWQAEAQKRLEAYFKDEQKAVVSHIEQSAIPSITPYRVEAALNETMPQLKSLLAQLYQDVAEDIGGDVSKAFEDASKSYYPSALKKKLKLMDKAIQYLLEVAGIRITQINGTELAEIQDALAEGVALGESIAKLAKRIDDLYVLQIIPDRSETIARTEVISASNWASMEAADQSGLTLNKEWLAAHDSRTRPAHAEADGQKVGMDEQFEVGGEPMDYPGDFGASAANVVNCRCTVIFERVKAANKPEKSIEPIDLEKMRPRDVFRAFTRRYA